jgi:hypothetical protein
MAMNLTIRVEEDRFEEAFSHAQIADEFEVAIGFPEDTAARDGTEEINNPTLAAILEHGSPANNLPARPFVEPGLETGRDRLARIMELGIQRTLDGDENGIAWALETAGVEGVSLVQRKMIQGPFAPNAPSTIKRKKSSRPLIDTGQLRQSVSYVVRAK